MMFGQMRSNKSTALVVGVVIFLAAFVGLAYNHLEPLQPNAEATDTELVPDGSSPPPSATPTPDTSAAEQALRDVYLQSLMKIVAKPNDTVVRQFGTLDIKLPGEAYFHEPLGENLCIIDMDSRPFTEPGHIFDEQGMSWDDAETVHGLAGGVLNHYVYAKIHGYKYYYINLESYEDRRDSWKKPPIMSAILKKHDVCIYLDSDAIFNRLDLPFEWLMNYWDINPVNNSLALAADPEHKNNHDKFGKTYLNTGFIVAQNNEKTFQIFDDWEECPNDGGKHPECTEFRTNRPGKPTDQGGFGTFIRYDYPKDIKELLCTEANGFPESKSGCEGKFIKHVWTGKNTYTKLIVGQQLPGDLLHAWHKQFLDDRKNFFITEPDLLGRPPKVPEAEAEAEDEPEKKATV
ncbi:hypothetical protein BGZ63DRAFT_203952 [Mariannaea sp. PMI_226]|nr:hypothetical protein BGZ63DRAFT_203952 [Mariannaea sp. PMI_226]